MNEMNFAMNHAPATGSIARPVGQQSSALPLYHECLQKKKKKNKNKNKKKKKNRKERKDIEVDQSLYYKSILHCSH